MRLGQVAAAAFTAVSASTAVATSSELVGGRIPSVPAVAAVRPALVVGVAREKCAASPAASRVDETAAATGAGCCRWGRWRSCWPAGAGNIGGGLLSN
jgi:hypothetical protein